MNINYKKSAKLTLLLISTILIASVSAVTYISLTATSTIAVYESQVYFVVGGDNGTKGLLVTFDSQNTTATLTGLRAYPNASFTYSNPIRVRNNATSGSSLPQLRLTPYLNPSTNAADFVYIKFLLNASDSGDRRWLNYTSNGVSWTNPSAPSEWTSTGINWSTEWPIEIYTKANATATAGHTVTIGIMIDVD